MKARPPRIEQHAARRAREHPGDRAPRVPVLAQDVAEAGPVACADGRDVDRLARVLDHECRVVLDARSCIERANQIVRLLTGAGRQAECLVERAHALDNAATEEDGERDRTVPEVVASEHGRVGGPPGLSARDAVEALEALRDALQQVGRIDAVVVGKSHGVRCEVLQPDIACPREAARGTKPLDLERRVRRKDTVDSIVVVLVDEEHAERAVRLRLERIEQAAELVDPVHGRDDKVESHGRTLTAVPLVSVLMSVHNDAEYLDEAVQSVLGQTLDDLELLVVDDDSVDATPEVLAAYDDTRVRVVRNDQRQGLAASLNRALELTDGRYVARLDADDVALPNRLERQVERLRSGPAVAVVGAGVIDLDEQGRHGRTHVMPFSARPLRWLALFSSPFFHPTVLVDRKTLDAHGLRYDPTFLESEDYDLWARLFAFADGENLPDPLVLKRVHAGQASQRRRDVQESFQQRVALREIGRLAPEVDAEAAWRVGTRRPGGSRREFLHLLGAFERRHGRDWSVRSAALRALLA